MPRPYLNWFAEVRNVYLFCIALISFDIIGFWLLKQIGVLGGSGISPRWVKIAFLAPIDFANVVLLLTTVYCAKSGIIYCQGGSEINHSEEPLRFWFNVSAQFLVFSVIIFVITAIMFKNP